jgi:LmbE family N-acetylglucosaminyl deacetylase
LSEILIAAPHPDDETLGCAGTLLRHGRDGDRLHWLIFTEMREEYGFDASAVAVRRQEIDATASQLHFSSIHELGFAPAGLDQVSKKQLVERVATVFNTVRPNILYVPYGGDSHSDHGAAFDALMACTKWFRFPTIRRVLAYETLSETDASLSVDSSSFKPNVFIDIGAFLDQKISIMAGYKSELHDFPFPRSERGLRALAEIRGVASGFAAAEAFMLLRERI